jgi:hypothetical protein
MDLSDTICMKRAFALVVSVWRCIRCRARATRLSLRNSLADSEPRKFTLVVCFSTACR